LPLGARQSGAPRAAHRGLLADADGARRNPKPHPLATAEFTTLRTRLLKIAGRITEAATRLRIAFAAACPQAALFRGVARGFQPAGP
jgi:hypothetical protein